MVAASTMDHDDAHCYMMWKGLTAVMGIVFFYFIERALTIIAGRWAQKKKNGKVSGLLSHLLGLQVAPNFILKLRGSSQDSHAFLRLKKQLPCPRKNF